MSRCTLSGGTYVGRGRTEIFPRNGCNSTLRTQQQRQQSLQVPPFYRGCSRFRRRTRRFTPICTSIPFITSLVPRSDQHSVLGSAWQVLTGCTNPPPLPFTSKSPERPNKRGCFAAFLPPSTKTIDVFPSPISNTALHAPAVVHSNVRMVTGCFRGRPREVYSPG